MAPPAPANVRPLKRSARKQAANYSSQTCAGLPPHQLPQDAHPAAPGSHTAPCEPSARARRSPSARGRRPSFVSGFVSGPVRTRHARGWRRHDLHFHRVCSGPSRKPRCLTAWSTFRILHAGIWRTQTTLGRGAACKWGIPAPPDLADTLANQFVLTGGQIDRACQTAAAHARMRNQAASALTHADLEAAARMQSSQALRQRAQKDRVDLPVGRPCGAA